MFFLLSLLQFVFFFILSLSRILSPFYSFTCLSRLSWLTFIWLWSLVRILIALWGDSISLFLGFIELAKSYLDSVSFLSACFLVLGILLPWLGTVCFKLYYSSVYEFILCFIVQTLRTWTLYLISCDSWFIFGDYSEFDI